MTTLTIMGRLPVFGELSLPRGPTASERARFNLRACAEFPTYARLIKQVPVGGPAILHRQNRSLIRRVDHRRIAGRDPNPRAIAFPRANSDLLQSTHNQPGLVFIHRFDQQTDHYPPSYNIKY